MTFVWLLCEEVPPGDNPESEQLQWKQSICYSSMGGCITSLLWHLKREAMHELNLFSPHCVVRTPRHQSRARQNLSPCLVFKLWRRPFLTPQYLAQEHANQYTRCGTLSFSRISIAPKWTVNVLTVTLRPYVKDLASCSLDLIPYCFPLTVSLPHRPPCNSSKPAKCHFIPIKNGCY